MSNLTRLNKLEKRLVSDRLWALIGIGKPASPRQQRSLEVKARKDFYQSGGKKEAYIAFLPFNGFEGFIGYIRRSELVDSITNQSSNPAERKGLPCLKKSQDFEGGGNP